MKLYYSPMACSLADHIALLEAGASFERESVDLKRKRTASGADFTKVARKGYVPVLVLEDGEVLTENIAILDWIASQYPALHADGPLGRTRTIEVLTYISTEIHRAFKPLWHQGNETDRQKAARTITALFDVLADGLTSDYLFGENPTVADFYLFVMLLWAMRFGVPTPVSFKALRVAMTARPAVRAAMAHEGLFDILREAASPGGA
jgi:glutathione S-transferase